MRYMKASVRLDPRRVPRLLGTTCGIEWIPYTRRLCLLAPSTRCLATPASHLQMVVSHSPRDTSWLTQASRTMCSVMPTRPSPTQDAISASWLTQASRTMCGVTQAKTAAAQNATLEKNTFKYVHPTTQLKMIMEYFNVAKTSSSKIINSDPRLKSCDVYTLARNMNTLQENEIDPEEVKKLLPLLYRSPLSIEHRIVILKELGLCNLTAQHCLQFSRLYKCTVAVLKRWRLLPENYEPREAVLASLGVPQELIFTTTLPRDINQCTLAELHMELSNVFLHWQLDCDHENINRIRQIYKIIKSMKLQKRVLHQLNHHWNINADKVLKNGYLLMCSPVNIALIEEEVGHIAGADIKALVTLSPRILSIPYHQLLQLDHILTNVGVTPASLISVPRICSLHPDTLQERLTLLQKVPEFAALYDHPRFLHLLVYFNKASSRLDLLHQMKNNNVLPSLNTLCGTSQMFHRYVTVGDLRYNKREVINCLAKQLNETTSIIRDALHFQSWSQSQTTVVSVRKNLLKLRKEGFTKEQLLMALDVVLYPPELLNDQLAQLPHKAQAQSFTDLKSEPHTLQLLLYFMEKKMSCTVA